jgi:hypothetical protein
LRVVIVVIVVELAGETVKISVIFNINIISDSAAFAALIV